MSTVLVASVAVVKTTQQKQLKGEGTDWVHSLRARKSCGGRIKELHCICSQEAGNNECLCCFLSPSHSALDFSQWNGALCSRSFHLTYSNLDNPSQPCLEASLVYIIPHGHTQSVLSWVILEAIKLTMKINYHKYLLCDSIDRCLTEQPTPWKINSTCWFVLESNERQNQTALSPLYISPSSDIKSLTSGFYIYEECRKSFSKSHL